MDDLLSHQQEYLALKRKHPRWEEEMLQEVLAEKRERNLIQPHLNFTRIAESSDFQTSVSLDIELIDSVLRGLG